MRLLVITTTRDDTTSLYRAAGIMKNLKMQMPDLDYDLHDLDKMQGLTWSLFTLYDAVFLQRPYKSLKLVTYLKDMGVPIWLDYDDNLFEIPAVNERAAKVYNDPVIRRELEEMAKLADIITVSTAGLKDVYDKFCKDVRVIPNALDFFYLGEAREKPDDKKVIIWRGGDSHRGDVYHYANKIFPAAVKHNDWLWLWSGFNFAERAAWYFCRDVVLEDLSKAFGNQKFEEPKDPTHYFRWLRNLGARAMHVPLSDSVFNRCKSNIAALEGTWSGAVCLVPDWEEWQIPGTLKYKDAAEFGEKLEAILLEQFSFNKYRGQALEYIKDVHNLTKVNGLRVQLIRDLIQLNK